MKNAWFAIPAIALSMGLASPAFAQDKISNFDDFFKVADTNKDGMLNRAEFVDAAGKRFDEMIAKMKQMPADESKMLMKGDMMTKRGVKTFLDTWDIYKGA